MYNSSLHVSSHARGAAAQCPPQWINLCVLICPLYKLIQDLIRKEQLKYSKGVVRIVVGREVWGATGVRNPQPTEVRMRAAARVSGEVVFPSELVE